MGYFTHLAFQHRSIAKEAPIPGGHLKAVAGVLVRRLPVAL
jgi:hypothetical protein